jgi:hypothetical protein
LGFSFFSFVIPTEMADFFFRAAVGRVGHGAEGPWQRFDRNSAVEIGKPFWSAVALPPLLRRQLDHPTPLIGTPISASALSFFKKCK